MKLIKSRNLSETYYHIEDNGLRTYTEFTIIKLIQVYNNFGLMKLAPRKYLIDELVCEFENIDDLINIIPEEFL